MVQAITEGLSNRDRRMLVIARRVLEKNCTVSEVAREHHVSTRTVYRAIDIARQNGINVSGVFTRPEMCRKKPKDQPCSPANSAA